VNTAAAAPGARLAPWLCFGLLLLPFHPLWIDFEQVRRGLLLMLAGGVLIAWPRLVAVRGDRFAMARAPPSRRSSPRDAR
jgi:hypothetical protein